MTSTLFETPREGPSLTVGVRSGPSRARLLWDALAREVLSPPVLLPVPEWVARHRVIPAGGGNVEGPWQHWRTPHAVRPMRILGGAKLGGDPRVREGVLNFASQCAKTEIVNNAALARISQLVTPTMWIVPNEKWAVRYTTNRFYPTLRQCAPLLALTGGKRDMKTLDLRLSNGSYVMWVESNSAANSRGTPAALRIIDELDVAGFDRSVVANVRDRGVTFDDDMMVTASVPSFEDVGIDAEYKGTNREEWQTPCPLCGFYQVLEFGGLDWRGGRTASDELVDATTVYKCEHCRDGINPAALGWMSARGWWCPAGVRVGADGRTLPDRLLAKGCGGVGGGGYLVDNDEETVEAMKLEGTPEVPSLQRVGWRLGAMQSLLYKGGWRAVVKQFTKQKGAADAGFVNGVLGETWKEKGEHVTESTLVRLCAPSPTHGGYERGEVPGGPGPKGDWTPPAFGALSPEQAAAVGGGRLAPALGHCGPLVLVGAVDVQHDRLYVLVTAVGARAGTQWVVWFDEVPAPEENQLAELDEVFGWAFPWQRPDGSGTGVGGAGLPVVAWVVDMGHRYKQVWRAVRRARRTGGVGRRFVYGVRGQKDTATSAQGPGWWISQVEYSADGGGEKVPGTEGGVECINVRVSTMKDFVYGNLRPPPAGSTKPGPIILPHRPDAVAGGSKAAVAARAEAQAVDGLLASFASEQRIKVESKDGSFIAIESMWKRRPGLAGKFNHYWDCAVYTAALVDALGGETFMPLPGLAVGGNARRGPEGIEASRHRGIERGGEPPTQRASENSGAFIDAGKTGEKWI